MTPFFDALQFIASPSDKNEEKKSPPRANESLALSHTNRFEV